MTHLLNNLREDRRGQAWESLFDGRLHLIVGDVKEAHVLLDLETGELSRAHWATFIEPIVGWRKVG